ncbi:MAG: uracil-DNA glycosylase [Candidatus Hadarchaeales archaeon]
MQAPLWGFMNPKTLEELEREAKNCKRCALHKGRTKLVFADGNPSKIVFVGEAPGYWEDQQGRPFVGAAGKFLNTLLERAGLRREEVYICNTVKCRPPGNRDPLPEEIEACKPFLVGQLTILKPKLVIALGRISAGELLGRPVSMTAEHGRLLDCTFAGLKFKLFLTFHPAAGLYSGSTKELLLKDFDQLKSIVVAVKSSWHF